MKDSKTSAWRFAIWRCVFPRAHFVYPVHLNPNVREPVLRILGALPSSLPLSHGQTVTPSHHLNIHLIEPLPYLAFVWLMNRSTLILTDSGGIQEEAPSLGKPVLVMRDTTERQEAVAAGAARLVGTRQESIVAQVARLLENPQALAEMSSRGGASKPLRRWPRHRTHSRGDSGFPSLNMPE